MEMELERRTVNCLRQRVRQVQNQEQTLELKLPEGYPDIGSVLCAWGQCLLRSKEWRTEGIGVSGGVMTWVLYLPADGSEPRWVEAWLPVQMKWEMPQTHREGSIRASWHLKGVDARMLSARKLLVRAGIGVLGEALEPCEAEVYAPMEVPEGVQLLKRTYPAMVPREAGEKTFLVDEEFPLPEGSTEEIVSCRVTPVLTEEKVVGGRAVFRGMAQIHLVCRGADGQLHSMDFQPEFSQFSDLDQDYDMDADISTVMALSNLEPEVQEGRLRVKCGMVAQYVVRDRVMLELVEDAYSPNRTLDTQHKELDIPMVLDSRTQTVTATASITEEPGRVADLSVWLEHPQVRRAGNLTELEVPGTVQMLSYSPNGELRASTGRFRGLWEFPAGDTTAVNAAVVSFDEPTAISTDGQTEAVVEMHMDVTCVGGQGMEMVSALELGELMPADPGRPSLILCRPGQRSLWELAKSTGSTVDAIRTANNLTEEPTDDRLLLIPVS